MSGFGDALEFEKFQLGDWADKIKENPEQLLIGAGDPISAGLWGSILDKEYEPFVNILGGPYGGSGEWSSGLGEGGGVYGRAREAGIDTGGAENIHDAAEVIASLAGLYYGAGAAGLGGGGGGAAGGGGGGFGLWGGGGAGTGVPSASGGGLGGWGGVGGGGGLGGAAGGGGGLMDFLTGGGSPEQYAQAGMQLMGGGEQEQPQFSGIPLSYSQFQPEGVGAPEVYSPQRAFPFGLLMTPEDEEQMRLIMGGLL